MTPKSRLYSLVRNWSKKPQQSVRDTSLHQPYRISEASESEQLIEWSKAQELIFELVLSTKDDCIQMVIMQSMQDAQSEDVIRLFNQGVQAAAYWHSFAKPTPIMMPFKTEWLMNPHVLVGIQNALFNCHLPIGLIQIGITDRSDAQHILVLQDALIKLQRMGILLHLLNFEGSEDDCQLIHDHSFTNIHLKPTLIRQAIPGSLCEKKLNHLNQIIHQYGSQSVAGSIKIIHDRTVAKKQLIDCYYGSNIMPPMTLHQVVKLGNRAQQKVIANSLIEKNVKKVL
jgi:EAL domain-containing protein (putative c-di-GMP-specific phosphodiesterase class I)